MSEDWENTFRSWARPALKNEQQRMENAVKAMKNTISSNSDLQKLDPEIILQGSYENNTNIREDSDVDIGVAIDRDKLIIRPYATARYLLNDYQLKCIDYREYKKLIVTSLRNHLYGSRIAEKNKSIKVYANTYHVNIDVVPLFYSGQKLFINHCVDEYELLANKENRFIKNYPKSHRENGILKNKETNNRYKYIVRVIKTLCNQMEQNRCLPCTLSGFMVESLLWNVSNCYFNDEKYYDTVMQCIEEIENLVSMYPYNMYEANGIKLLFSDEQKLQCSDILRFVKAAISYIS